MQNCSLLIWAGQSARTPDPDEILSLRCIVCRRPADGRFAGKEMAAQIIGVVMTDAADHKLHCGMPHKGIDLRRECDIHQIAAVDPQGFLRVMEKDAVK